mmetsp:Transcript_138060/g.240014  ORF Transcript_138060/g.240014 Transcript_138060/m.240014 type:complete len:331 (-) Transcript_138060:522-1514(-)
MASHVSYSTSYDVENLIESNRPSKRSSATMYLSVLVAVGCAGVLLGQVASAFTAPVQNVIQTRPNVAPQMRVAPRPASWSNEVMEQKAQPNLLQKMGAGLAALSLSGMANMGTPMIAEANEATLLQEPTPTADYVFDDGGFLSKSGVQTLQEKLLPELEARTGYRVNVVTLRKLVIADDAFQFADNLIETWYPTAELGDKKAVFVLVKNSKEAGIVGGPSFSNVISADFIQSLLDDNIAVLAGEEKYNAAVISSVKRLDAVLSSQPDPGPPRIASIQKAQAKAKKDSASNYKDKEETEEKKGIYGFAVVGLLTISFVAPMVQYFSFTKEE